MTESDVGIDTADLRRRVPDGWRVEGGGAGVTGYADEDETGRLVRPDGVPACFAIHPEGSLWGRRGSSPTSWATTSARCPTTSRGPESGASRGSSSGSATPKGVITRSYWSSPAGLRQTGSGPVTVIGRLCSGTGGLAET